ncbi:MAG TPA: AgmX/PglI C-terminal domain-containing protein [Polyangiaceae bacterium]|jgi:hypothetical protein|nr:AgmX/PglI C-terminal domain-containing protein [Polyangiaceae bacterium]
MTTGICPSTSPARARSGSSSASSASSTRATGAIAASLAAGRGRFALAVLLTFAAPLAVAAGCGGGDAAGEGPKAPAGASSNSAGAADPGAPATTASTTTVSLPDGGDLQGAKLTEVHTVASTTATSSPAPKGPHAHEPGRQPDDIRAIILARRDDARACYDNALKDHPGIEGDLVITWTIDPKGNVTQTSLDTSKSQIVEPTVVDCVSSIIKKIQFAASAGGYETKAYYPFNFHPHKGGGSH